MRRSTRLGVAALTLASGAAEACGTARRPPAFCIELRRVIEAAQHEDGFEHLERGRAAPPRLGFFPGCRAGGGGAQHAWLCHQSLAPDHLSLARLAEKTASCLPEAERLPSAYPRHEALFALPHVRIRITESGGPGAHVGRIVGYSVETPAPSN